MQQRHAVIDSQAGITTFREFPDGPLSGHSGLKSGRSETEWNRLIRSHQGQKYVDHIVTTTTLDILLRTANVAAIDYFSLDVEGAEMEILRGYPFQRVPVGLWSIESNKLDRGTLVAFMRDKGYGCHHYDKINTVCSQSLNNMIG
jgi:hypothetical protein